MEYNGLFTNNIYDLVTYALKLTDINLEDENTLKSILDTVLNNLTESQLIELLFKVIDINYADEKDENTFKSILDIILNNLSKIQLTLCDL